MKNILGILFSFLLISPIFAEEFEDLYDEATLDENTETSDTTTEDTNDEEVVDTTSEEYLSQNFYTVEIVRGSQSAFDKYVPLTVRIIPNETPVKTQITWDVPDTMDIRVKHSEFISSMVEGETYEYKVRIKPSESGTYEITVNVTAWQHDSNYTSSESILIEFDNNLVVDSSDTNYVVSMVAKVVLIILALGGAGYGIYIGGKKLMKILSVYLKPPEL